MKFYFASLLLAKLAFSAPAHQSDEDVTVTQYVDSQPTSYDWSENWVKNFPIHKSCNDSQYNQLEQALQETRLLASHARDHTLKFGKGSEFYQKYFANASTGEVVGWFENIVSADKSDVLFRCDDIDGNCKLDGWAGHWRGENGTNENVICDLSYTSKLFLSQMCSQGYTVSQSKNSLFWAGDLLHRIWHTDSLGQEVVGHYADTYDECLELAKLNTTESVRNSASLRFYALDVYAYDIAVPGKGCTGKKEKNESGSNDSLPTLTTEPKSTAEPKGGSECHTHANGEKHCA